MRRHNLIEALKTSPFRPFRLHVSDGSTFEIRHPEMLMVTRHAAIVGILSSADRSSAEEYPEISRSTTVDLMHVTQLEELRQGSN